MVSGMGEPRTYPHGVTSWIDTEQPDLEAARVFYAGLFGWRMTDASAARRAGVVPHRHHRRSGRRRGRAHAGGRCPMEHLRRRGQRRCNGGGRHGQWRHSYGATRGRRPSWPCRHLRRPVRCGVSALAGRYAAGRATRELARSLELQRSLHARPRRRDGLLHTVVRLAGRRPRPGCGHDAAGPRVRRPPRRHGRPRHP